MQDKYFSKGTNKTVMVETSCASNFI